MWRGLKWFLIFISVPLLYVAWRVFRVVANRCDRSWSRLKGDEYQTPVVVYRHPKTRRMVVIIGMIHVGERRYYEDVLRTIEAKSDFRVLFEQVRGLHEIEPASLSESELGVLRFFAFAKRFQNLACTTTGLVKQGDALPIAPSWINTDMIARDLVRKLAQVRHLRKPMPVYDWHELEKTDHRGRLRPLFDWVLINLYALFALGDLVRIFGRSAMHNILVKERDAIALAGIAEHVQHANVCATWGVAHLPGIDRGLRALGFIQHSRAWLTVFRMPASSSGDVLESLDHFVGLASGSQEN